MTEAQILSSAVLVLIAFVLGGLLAHRAFTAGLKAAVEQSSSLKNDQPVLDLIAAASKNVDPLIIKDIIAPIAQFTSVLADIIKLLPPSPITDVAAIVDNVAEVVAKGAEGAAPPLTLVKGAAPAAGEPAG